MHPRSIKSFLPPFYHLSTFDITHVRKDTRPSVFIVQPKMARAWERSYLTLHLVSFSCKELQVTSIKLLKFVLKVYADNLNGRKNTATHSALGHPAITMSRNNLSFNLIPTCNNSHSARALAVL